MIIGFGSYLRSSLVATACPAPLPDNVQRCDKDSDCPQGQHCPSSSGLCTLDDAGTVAVDASASDTTLLDATDHDVAIGDIVAVDSHVDAGSDAAIVDAALPTDAFATADVVPMLDSTCQHDSRYDYRVSLMQGLSAVDFAESAAWSLPLAPANLQATTTPR